MIWALIIAAALAVWPESAEAILGVSSGVGAGWLLNEWT